MAVNPCLGWWLWVALCALLANTPAHAQSVTAGRRVALLIGNADYAGQKPLRNPGNDVQDMAATLQQLGFKVTPQTNLGRS